MPTLYIKQLKQHTPKGNSWKWGRKLYCQVRKLSPIYSLIALIYFQNLHTHFKYVLTNFVTSPTPPRNASSHLPTLQASTEYFDSCGHFSDPNSINMQSSGFVISWTKRKATMPIITKCRTPSVTSPKSVPTPGWSEPQLVDIQSTILSRVPSVSTTKINS